MRPLVLLLVLLFWNHPGSLRAQAPNYEQFRLDGLYPAGGKQGERVVVEFMGGNNANFTGVKQIVFDGPPGLTAHEIKLLAPNRVQATLAVAPEAPPGRRCVRLLTERSGLSNMIYFSVGRVPEVLEKEPNNDTTTAQDVTLPVVVNGKVNPRADVDCYRFPLKKGQKIVAAVLAHALDSHGQNRNFGFVDASLQIVDENGRVVAEASDTLGLDPQVEFEAVADGVFIAKVSLEAFEGFPQAVYRLTLGELPLATSVFPPGGRRGTTVQVALNGPNLARDTRQLVKVGDDAMPWQTVMPSGGAAGDLELPFLRGDLPERLEVEPNQDRSQATPLEVSMTVNARIDAAGDVDWYRLPLDAGQSVVFETTAQRFLRSPLDTHLAVYDASGKKLAENDDGFPIHYVSMHDYRTMDSRLSFTAPAKAQYYLRVCDQSGGGGLRSVYRLTVTPAEPNFELFLYPDGVPIWGPGSTASLLVVVHRFDGMQDDIALTVEGLPAGWTASQATSRGRAAAPAQDPVLYYFLTITAPGDAKAGEMSSIRVVGRAETKRRKLERIALPLTWYYTSDIGLFRITPLARVAVASPQSPWLSTDVETIKTTPGGSVEIPLKVVGADKLDKIDLNVDLAGNGVGCAVGAPQTVAIRDGLAILPLKIPDAIKPGNHGIVVSLRWRSDVRIGMPGPCTRLITLEVTESKK